MDCKQVQQQLSIAAEKDATVQQHLQSCESCRQFASDLEAIQGKIDPGVSTPVLLRENTLDRCRFILADLSTRKSTSKTQRLRILFESPRFVAVTAALSGLLLATSIVLQVLTDPDPDTNMIVKISILQIVLQNFIAALFMPALLMYKNRLGGKSLTTAKTGE
jgi:hypothetical protein